MIHTPFYSNGRPKCVLDSSQINCIATYFHQTTGHVLTLSESNIPDSVFKAVKRTGYRAQPLVDEFKAKFKSNQTLSKEDLAFISLHTGHSFMSGYNIPEPLKNEYELLWQLVHNPAKNIEATQNIATCIGIRGKQIRTLTKQYADKLILIGTNPDLKRQRLADAKARLDVLLSDFDNQLAKKVYEGFDAHLKVNAAILARYELTIQIKSIADLEQLQIFPPETLKTLLAEQEHEQQKVIDMSQLTESNIEEVTIFLVNAPAQILDVVLPYTINVLNLSLTYLDSIFDMIDPEKKAILIKYLVNYEYFERLLTILSPEERTEAFKAIKTQFSQIITSGTGFANVIKFVMPQQRAEVYEAMKTQFRKIIKDSFNFEIVLGALTPEQRAEVYEEMKTELPFLVKHLIDLTHVLKVLTPNQLTEFLENKTMKQTLINMIQYVRNFRFIFDFLSPQQAKAFFSSKTVQNLLESLGEEQRTLIYEELKEFLPLMYTTRADLMHIFRNFNKDDCSKILAVLKDNVDSMIPTSSQMRLVIEMLSQEQVFLVIAALSKKHLSDLLEHGFIFSLDKSDRNKLIVAKPDVITNISSLKSWLKDNSMLTTEQRKIFFEKMKENLPRMFNRCKNLDVLQYLTTEERTVFFESFIKRLHDMIKDSSSLETALQYLTKEECQIVCNSIKPKLSKIVPSVSAFINIFNNLNSVQKEAIIEALQKNLATIITDQTELLALLQLLTPEQCKAVCGALEPMFTKTITDDIAFWNTLESLDDEKFTSVCQSFKSYLPELSTKSQRLSSPFNLSPEKKEIFLKVATQARLERYMEKNESHRPPQNQAYFRYASCYSFFRENQNRQKSFVFAEKMLKALPSVQSIEELNHLMTEYLEKNSIDDTELNEILQNIQSYAPKKT